MSPSLGLGWRGKKDPYLRSWRLGQAQEPQKSPHLITCAKIPRLGQPLSLSPSLSSFPSLLYLTFLPISCSPLYHGRHQTWKIYRSQSSGVMSPLPSLSSYQFMASLIPSISSSVSFPRLLWRKSPVIWHFIHVSVNLSPKDKDLLKKSTHYIIIACKNINDSLISPNICSVANSPPLFQKFSFSSLWIRIQRRSMHCLMISLLLSSLEVFCWNARLYSL